jgi:hypothetical protein
MWDDVDRQRHMRVLEAAGMAQASEELLDLAELARVLDTSEPVVRMDIGQLHALGLVLDGLEEGLPPMLLNAGRQFLARGGDVDHDVLGFLPRVIDDLNAREGLLVAGTLLVDEFRVALLRGDAVEHAQQMVPPAFIAAVDKRFALDLVAAAAALMARLSDGAPAGCVAEEIIAVRLIQEARVWLEMRREEGELDDAEERAASDQLRSPSSSSKTTTSSTCSRWLSPPTRHSPATIRSTSTSAWSINAFSPGSAP